MPAPTYDATAGVVASGTSSGNASHSLGSGSGNNRIVLLWCFSRGNSEADTAITGCTYNGSSAGVTYYGSYRTGAAFNVRVTLYYVLDAALPASSGSYNAACSSSGGQQTGIVAVSFTGANQSAPFGNETQVARESAVDPINDSLTPSGASVIVDADACDLFGGSATTTQTGQTERFDGAGSTDLLALVSTRSSSATPNAGTLGWDRSTAPNRSEHWLIEVMGVGANVEVGNIAQGNAGSTTSHTLTTKENRGVIVLIDDESQSHATGVTYNGVSMTLVCQDTSTQGAGNAASMWFILDADLPTGGASYNVSVSGLDSGASVTVIEVNGIAQVIPSGAAVDTNNTGNVSTSSTTVTAPAGNSVSVGCLGYGNDTATFISPPTGTGTWVRPFSPIYGPPTSAWLGAAYQYWTTSGSKTYTESADGNWFRSAHLHAVFAEYTPPAAADFDTWFGDGF
jgi:hypothetical protein